MRRTEAKPTTPCRRGYCRLPLAKAHRAAGSHDQGRDAGKRPVAPGQRYALFNTHSGNIQMPANVLPTNSRLFPVSRMRRMAPRNGLYRTLERPVSGCKTAHSGSPNGTCRQLAEWQRVVWSGSMVAQKHRIATATGPQQRNQTAAAGPASQLLGRCKPKKTKIKDFITWYRYHFCKNDYLCLQNEYLK